MMVAQEKTESYVKRTPSNDFTPVVIETYRGLRSRFDSFFIACAQTIIACH